MTVSLPRAAALAFAAILLFAAATDYVPAFRDAAERLRAFGRTSSKTARPRPICGAPRCGRGRPP